MSRGENGLGSEETRSGCICPTEDGVSDSLAQLYHLTAPPTHIFLKPECPQVEHERDIRLLRGC